MAAQENEDSPLPIVSISTVADSPDDSSSLEIATDSSDGSSADATSETPSAAAERERLMLDDVSDVGSCRHNPWVRESSCVQLSLFNASNGGGRCRLESWKMARFHQTYQAPLPSFFLWSPSFPLMTADLFGRWLALHVLCLGGRVRGRGQPRAGRRHSRDCHGQNG